MPAVDSLIGWTVDREGGFAKKDGRGEPRGTIPGGNRNTGAINVVVRGAVMGSAGGER